MEEAHYQYRPRYNYGSVQRMHIINMVEGLQYRSVISVPTWLRSTKPRNLLKGLLVAVFIWKIIFLQTRLLLTYILSSVCCCIQRLLRSLEHAIINTFGSLDNSSVVL